MSASIIPPPFCSASRAYVFFSFRPDQPALIQALRAIRQRDPAAMIAVYADDSLPVKIPQGLCDHYEETKWDRRGNLNGQECVRGELTAFHETAERFAVEYIAKIDSDTLVTTPELAFSRAVATGADLIGASQHSYGVFGPFYILRTSILPSLLPLVETHCRVAQEDQAISNLVNAAGGKVVVCRWAEKFFNGFDYRLRHFDMRRFLTTGAVTFGNRSQLLGDDPRRVVARAMEALQYHLTSGKPFAWDFVLEGHAVKNNVGETVAENAKKNCGAPGATDASRADTAAVLEMTGVAVVVTCHAPYLHYLPALLAAWDQQGAIERVLCLDECDYTAPPGWRVLRGSWGHPGAARNAALRIISAAWVLYWDADNTPSPRYLERAQIVTADAAEHMGAFCPAVVWDGRVIASGRVGDLRDSFRVDTASVWRRQALLHAGGWDTQPTTLEDWELAKRLTSLGWAIDPLGATLNVQDHGDRRSHSLSTDEALWPLRSVGIITLFAGRWTLLQRWVRMILSLDLPPRCGLTVVDDSSDHVFRAELSRAVKTVSPRFERVTVLTSPDAEQVTGFSAIHQRVGRLYSRAIAATPEDLILTIEDDVFPHRDDALRTLAASILPGQRKAAVAGAYADRENDQVAVAALNLKEWERMPLFSWLGTRLVRVGMVGFGFTLWNRPALEACPVLGQFTLPNGHRLGFDGFVCRRLNAAGWEFLLDGNVPCDHLCHPNS